MDRNPYGYYLYHDRIAWHCQNWALWHQKDTVAQLRREIDLIKSSLRPTSTDENLNRSARRDNAIGVALILLAQSMIDDKLKKQWRAELEKTGDMTLKQSPKPRARHESKHLPPTQTPEEHTARDQMWATNERLKQAAEEARKRALEEGLANDPDVLRIKDLQNKIADQEQRLTGLLDRAQAGDGYATDALITDGVKGLLSDGREIEKLRDSVQGKYGVTIGDGSEGASIGAAIGRSIEVVESRRVKSIGQKYGLWGRQPLRAPGSGMPRRSREEMKADLAAILSYEHQRQLLGVENEDLSREVTEVITGVSKYGRAQTNADLKRVLTEIQMRKNSIGRAEIDRLADGLVIQLLGDERQQQLLGNESDDTAGLIDQVAAAKSDAKQ